MHRYRMLGLAGLAMVGCKSAARVPPRPAAAAPATVESTAPDPRLATAIAELRAAAARGDRQACADLLGGIDATWLGHEAQAQDALDAARACTGREDAYCDYYLELFGGDESQPYCQLALDVAMAPRAAYADAVAVPCGFGDEDVTAALPGDPERCVAVVGGTDIELDELPDDGSLPEGVCPSLVLLERHGARVDRRPLSRQGGSMLEDASNCCHATALATRRHGGEVEVVLSSDGPSRDCFGGTASIDELEVYRLDGDTLVPVANLGILMH